MPMAPGSPFKLRPNPLDPVSVPVSSHVLDDLGHVLGFVSICFWPQVVTFRVGIADLFALPTQGIS